MQINDLSARIRANEAVVRAAIERVLASGWVILGPEVQRFEADFARQLGAAHCVGVANGTDAIELALRGVGVVAGDKVATVANAGMYSTIAMTAAGAVPLFMDVDLDSYNVGAKEVERALRAGVRAVIITHLYGQPVMEIAEIARLCWEAGVPLLEDCAQAHGAAVDGRQVGTFGSAASFSFYPTKNLGALGDGGAVVSPHDDVADRVRKLRQYGWTDKYCVEFGGARNSRLDELQAAILSAFLPGLDQANARRREIAAFYGRLIQNEAVTLPRSAGTPVAHLYVVRCARREDLRAHLKAAGIGTDIHYPIPDHRQPLLAQRYGGVHLPNTERLAQEVLTLPCYPEMCDEDVHAVARAVNTWKHAHAKVR